MWNQISCKPEYQLFLKQRQAAVHKSKVLSATAVIDSKRPVSRPRKTRTKIRIQRNNSIQQANKMLMNKMVAIHSKPVRMEAPFSMISSNQKKRSQEKKRIQSQNEQFLKRILRISSSYQMHDWHQSSVYQLHLKRNQSVRSRKSSASLTREEKLINKILNRRMSRPSTSKSRV